MKESKQLGSDLLVEALARALPPSEARGAGVDGRDDLEAAIRAELFDESPSPLETRLIKDSAPSTEEELAARFVRARVCRALEVATRSRGLDFDRMPSIVVAIGEPGSLGAARAEATARATVREGRRDGGWLVLADARNFEAIDRARRISDHPVLCEVALAKLGERELSATRRGTPVRVLHVAEAIAALREIVPRALAATSTVGGGTLGLSAQREPESLLGALIGGKYLLKRCIGVGGFGTVYEAIDLSLETRVAIKILNRRGESADDDADEFVREARRVTRLQHPNIVGWKAFDRTEDGTCYFVMELLEGRNLDQLVDEEGAIPPRRVLAILRELLGALRVAHANADPEPILHLDLTPRNVLLVPHPDDPGRESVKVIDFGVGQLRREPVAPRRAPREEAPASPAGAAAASAPRDEPHAGSPVRVNACTPEYAAPEHCAHLLEEQDTVLDARADLYSVGMLAYYLLTASLPFHVPFDRSDLLEIKQALDIPPVARRAPDLPADWCRFLDRCLATDRDDRWPDAEAALAALDRIARSARRRRAATVAAPLAFVLAAVLFLLWPEPAVPASLVVLEAGGETPLAGEPLFLGPDRPTARLRVDGIPPSETIAGVRVLRRRSPDVEADAAIAAAWLGDGEVALRARFDEERFRGPLYLELEGEEGAAVLSEAFELVWIGRECVSVRSVDSPAPAGSSVDPSGAFLRVSIAGRPEEVERVWIETARGARETTLESFDEASSVLRYRASLDGLFEGSGSRRVVVVARDRARGVDRVPAAVDVVSEPLRFLRAEIDGTRVGDEFLLHSLEDLGVRVRLSGVADVRWTLGRAGRGTSLQGAREAVIADEIELDVRDALRGDESFSGWLELEATDSAYVHRADPDRGRASASIPLTYFAGRPSIDFHLEDGHGVALEGADGGAVFHTRGEGLRLVVTRFDDPAVRVAPRLEDASSGATVAELSPRTIVDPAERTAAWELPIDREGRLALTVSAWRYHPALVASERSPDVVSASTIVVDRAAPSLAVEDRAPIVATGRDARPEIELAVSDGEAGGSPVEVRWELARAREDAGRPVAAGSVGWLEGQRTVAAPLPTRGGMPPWTGYDGSYVLSLRGVDRAGNPSEPSSIAIEYSERGPELSFVEPVPNGAIVPTLDGRFRLRVAARDGNGVVSVTATIPARAGASEAARVALEPDGADSWRAWIERPLDARAGETVLISVSAVDGARERTSLIAPFEIAPAHASAPEVVVARGAGRVPTEMVHVRGNVDLPYVFGGRSDEEENVLCAARGLPPFDLLAIERCWRVSFAAGSIASFYLDAEEVTVAQFAAFLEDAGAWADEGRWPSGPPPAGRREELARALARLGADRPVTGVTWDEAAAFASWAGKRLPSLVEWELGVRGGASYRARATDVRTGEGASVPAIRGLTSGVAEWTATPASFLDGGEIPADMGAHARAHREGFLAPWLVEGSDARPDYWIAGEAPAGRADFASVTFRPRAWRGPSAGFRCAVGVEEVLDSISAGSTGGGVARFAVRE